MFRSGQANATLPDAVVFDFLMPSTDAGVAVQFAGWAVLSVGSLFATRRNRDLRLLVLGISILVLGVMTVRAVH